MELSLDTAGEKCQILLTKFIDSLAGSMSRATLWAGKTLATSSRVAIKALAFASAAITQTTIGTLHVEVTLVVDRVLFACHAGTVKITGPHLPCTLRTRLRAEILVDGVTVVVTD